MSRKKHSINYIKPDEPAFLKRLKKEAGFVEGPTVDTKREHFESNEEEDDLDWGTVVVLKPGDLTEEQARGLKSAQDSEKEAAPADLNKKIVFKAPIKKRINDSEESTSESTKPVKKVKKAETKTNLLSFDDEEEEDE